MKNWQTKPGTVITRIMQGRSNVYLITHGNLRILVDTGGQNRRRDLLKTLDKLALPKLDYLVLTHTHFDHAGNTAAVHELYRPKVVVQKAERLILEQGFSVVPKGTMFFTKAAVKLGGEYFARLSRFKPCQVDVAVDEEYILPEYAGIRIIATPGHSAGSQCIVVDGEYALVGDTLFGMFVGGIYPPFADGPELLLVSWQKLLDSGCHTFLPGHGSARKRDMLLRRHQVRQK